MTPSPSRSRVLAALSTDWLSVAEIAERSGLAPGTVSRTLARFGSAGPVERKYVESGKPNYSCLRTLRTMYRLRKDYERRPEHGGSNLFPGGRR